MEPQIDDEDRARLCVEFALRARQIRVELEQFADWLAQDDAELRTQLRVVEEWLW